MLLRSLEKGNLQSVTFEKDGSTSKVLVEANPQFKSINIYDGQMSRYKGSDRRLSVHPLAANKAVQMESKQEVKDNNENKKREVNESKKILNQ